MERIKHESSEFARIEGVGVVKLAQVRMSLNQSINAKSHQSGLPTKYFRGGMLRYEYLRCFISLCNVRINEYKESPNMGVFRHPNAF
jgi:hypothetical protein